MTRASTAADFSGNVMINKDAECGDSLEHGADQLLTR